MLFDYRYWLRRFLDWLLNDADESEKMVTKGLIGETPFLDAIASPSTYPCQSLGESVIHSFRFGDSYCNRISELVEN